MDIREFKNIYKNYAPSIIWDWCAKPTAEEIDARLYEFSEMGISEVFIRPSKGLALPYLSDDYFELIRTAARRSGKYGVTLFICDENSSSSGNGGGEITSVPDYRLRDLLEISKNNLEKTDEVISEDSSSFLILRDMSKVRASKRAPLADITDAFVTECFIDAVYNKYLRECKRFSGIEIKGFSTNICFPENASIYSPAAIKKLGITNSKAILNEERTRYYKALSLCTSENFTGLLKEKCNSNDLLLSVSVEGEKLVSRQLQYLKCDTVLVSADSEDTDFIQIKLAQTICDQFEKPLNIKLHLPSFAPCSQRYNMASFMASFGAEKIIYDSVPFSLSDRRKYEKNTVSVSKFAEKAMSDRIARLCFMSSNTKYDTKLLIVYNPNEKEIYQDITEKLISEGIPFHMVEELFFEKYAYDSGDYITIGKYEYTTIIKPDRDYPVLENYKGNIIASSSESINSLLPIENTLPINADKKIFINRRSDGDNEFIFVTAKDEDTEIMVLPEDKKLFASDFSNGELYTVRENEGVCKIILKAGKTAMLIHSPELSEDFAPPYTDDIEFVPRETEGEIPFMLSAAEENILPLKRVNACFGKKSFRENSIDNLHREFYSLTDGETVKVKYPFNADTKNIGEVKAYIEYASNMEFIELNGIRINDFTPSPKDPRFIGTDITKLLADGKNTLAVEYKKRNNYTPDFSSFTPSHYYSYNITTFEPVYLCGDFDSYENSLVRLTEYESDITKSGMDYYYGSLTYCAKLPESDLSEKVLAIYGDFDICRIKIGKRTFTYFSETPIIEVFNLDCGTVAEITIYNTPHNLLRSEKEEVTPFGLSKIEICSFN